MQVKHRAGVGIDCKKFFETDDFNRLLENKPKEIAEYHEAERKYLHAIISGRQNARVLDVGCGSGDSINHIVDLGHEIVGIDNAEHQLEIARDRFRNNGRITLFNFNALSLPNNWAGSFDFVVCMGATFGNLSRQVAVVREMARVIKQGGRILLSVYSMNARQVQRAWYSSVTKVVFENEDFTLVEGGVVSERFTPEKLAKIASEAGLVLEKVDLLTPIAYMATLRKP